MEGINHSSSIYTVRFDGKNIETTVTNEAKTVSNWVREMFLLHGSKPQVVVGLDNEWRPHPVPYMSNKTATLQLCVDNKCLIIQLLYLDEIPQLLRDFLARPNFVFVGVEVDNDVMKLKDEYGLICNKTADIREEAKMQWPGMFRRPGLKDLAFQVAGLSMAKPLYVTKSLWDSRSLSVDQVEYACIDAYASYKIGHILMTLDDDLESEF